MSMRRIHFRWLLIDPDARKDRIILTNMSFGRMHRLKSILRIVRNWEGESTQLETENKNMWVSKKKKFILKHKLDLFAVRSWFSGGVAGQLGSDGTKPDTAATGGCWDDVEGLFSYILREKI